MTNIFYIKLPFRYRESLVAPSLAVFVPDGILVLRPFLLRLLECTRLDAHVLERAALDLDLGYFLEAVAMGVGDDDVLQTDVHELVALEEGAVVGVASLGLDQLG